MADISNHQIGAKSVSYTLSILPIMPIMKLEGFGPEGMEWEDAEIGNFRMGADGLGAKNQKPSTYKCTLNLQPNSNLVPEMDNILNLIRVAWGKSLVDYVLILVEVNNATGNKTIWSNGMFTSDQSGTPVNLEDGQQTRKYHMEFMNKTVFPL